MVVEDSTEGRELSLALAAISAYVAYAEGKADAEKDDARKARAKDAAKWARRMLAAFILFKGV